MQPRLTAPPRCRCLQVRPLLGLATGLMQAMGVVQVPSTTRTAATSTSVTTATAVAQDALVEVAEAAYRPRPEQVLPAVQHAAEAAVGEAAGYAGEAAGAAAGAVHSATEKVRGGEEGRGSGQGRSVRGRRGVGGSVRAVLGRVPLARRLLGKGKQGVEGVAEGAGAAAEATQDAASKAGSQAAAGGRRRWWRVSALLRRVPLVRRLVRGPAQQHKGSFTAAGASSGGLSAEQQAALQRLDSQQGGSGRNGLLSRAGSLVRSVAGRLPIVRRLVAKGSVYDDEELNRMGTSEYDCWEPPGCSATADRASADIRREERHGRYVKRTAAAIVAGAGVLLAAVAAGGDGGTTGKGSRCAELQHRLSSSLARGGTAGAEAGARWTGDVLGTGRGSSAAAADAPYGAEDEGGLGASPFASAAGAGGGAAQLGRGKSLGSGSLGGSAAGDAGDAGGGGGGGGTRPGRVALPGRKSSKKAEQWERASLQDARSLQRSYSEKQREYWEAFHGE